MKRNQRKVAALFGALGNPDCLSGGRSEIIYSPAPDVLVIEMTLTFVLYCIVQLQQGPSFTYVSN